jgi:5-amino-6-(5-phospho-D-ribitylamino)uracil phosphatase
VELLVFDLDGTLLNQYSEISPYTQETLALLSSKGISYTLATGRTLHSAQEIIEGHRFPLPQIYSNGVITWDPSNQTIVLDNVLTVADAVVAMEAAFSQGLTPFITAIDKNNKQTIYHSEIKQKVEQRLLNTFYIRRGIAIRSIEDMPSHAQITNISMLGLAADIDKVEQRIRQHDHLITYCGPAIEEQGLKWMDVHHSDANKGSAVDKLCQQLGVRNLVCFGDNDNDLSMFARADESYAPENASANVKAAATNVIGHHQEDGIAVYLRERFDLTR